VATALDSALVVRVLDGAGKAVSGVSLKWAAVGGGSLSASTSTTDNNGLSSVQWTLSPAVGPQVVTVTSAQIGGASVSFVAGNGPTIMGTVTSIAVNPFAPSFSRATLGAAVANNARSASASAVARRLLSNRIVIGFKSGALGLAPVGSMAYRAMSVAQPAADRLRTRVGVLGSLHGLRRPEVSPAILAARLTLDDTARIDSVIAALRGESDVAYVEREQWITIHNGAPHERAVTSAALGKTSGWETSSSVPTRSGVNTLIPRDIYYPYEMWAANMVDLPKAWALTTGSANVTVAVLDMGVRFEHPSLAGNFTKDGYDFVAGFAFDSTNVNCDDGKPFPFMTTAADGDGPDPDPTDVDDIGFSAIFNCWFHVSSGDHGLWTSGIIGAVGNQNLGMAGVSWSAKIRPVRVLDITGSGTFFDIAQGLLYAAGLPALGANNAMVQTTRAPVINMSLGGGFDDPVMADAVAAAVNAGSLIVASAGNEGFDNLPNLQTFPAAYPGVMAVAAVGMDGVLSTYTNVGTNISVAAPGGDFRLDDNGGGAVIGPGWDFEADTAAFMLGYGTSASAPFVSGIAALLLSQTPGLTAAQLRSRIEQFATRPPGAGRSDSFGWGIVNAYNALTQTTGPSRQANARLIDATTGAVARTTKVNGDGSFAFTKIANGTSYYLQAGEDEAGDGVIGVPGRRFAVAGGLGNPTVFNVNGGTQSVGLPLGIPLESEPNDDVAHANLLSVGSYVFGSITTPDTRDLYRVTIPAAGTYTFETSGVLGSCGYGIELDTFLNVSSAAGTSVGSSDNLNTLPNPLCSRVRAQLTPGIYYATVSGTSTFGFSTGRGRYRLEVRSGN
jgi:subtilisin family serine protease